jgi:hypothetical protein
MPRKGLYAEGRGQLSIAVRLNVKRALEDIAERNHQSTSQLCNVILEDWLLRRGELREREEAAV